MRRKIKRCISCLAEVVPGSKNCAACGKILKSSQKTYFEKKKKEWIEYFNRLLDKQLKPKGKK